MEYSSHCIMVTLTQLVQLPNTSLRLLGNTVKQEIIQKDEPKEVQGSQLPLIRYNSTTSPHSLN